MDLSDEAWKQSMSAATVLQDAQRQLRDQDQMYTTGTSDVTHTRPQVCTDGLLAASLLVTDSQDGIISLDVNLTPCHRATYKSSW